MPQDDESQPIRGTASFAKFVRVLQCVADAPGRYTVADLAKQTQIPRPTMHRIVSALVHEGMLGEPGGRKGLVLGSRLISLAYRSWDEFALRRVARPALERLNRELDETVHLAVSAGTEMVYVDKLESRQTVRMTSRLGTRVTLYASAVGKAWLAALPPAECLALTRAIDMQALTRHTMTSPAQLDLDLKTTRERGYALDLQEQELDICCYGGAIIVDGRPQGCVSISMPRYRFEALPRDTATTALALCTQSMASALLSDMPQ